MSLKYNISKYDADIYTIGAQLPCAFENDGRNCPYQPLSFVEGDNKIIPCRGTHRYLPLCPRISAQKLCIGSSSVKGKPLMCPFYHPKKVNTEIIITSSL